MKRLKRAQGGVFPYQDGQTKAWGINFTDGLGRRRQLVGFRTKDEAIGEKHKQETAGNTWVKGDPPRFDEAVKQYRKWRLDKGGRSSSYEYLKLWTAAIGDRPLAKISPDMISAHLARWQTERGWSPASRNRVLAQLSGAFSWFLAQAWIDRHPVKGRVLKHPEDNARERWLRLDEIETIREHSPAWLSDIIQVAVTTGMRLGEICGLTRASYLEISHERAFLVTQETKNGDPLHWPLAGWLLEDVRERARQAPFPGSFLYPGPGVVRKNGRRDAGRNARSSIRRALPTAVRKAGLTWGLYETTDKGERIRIHDGITFHTFRHSMASLGLNNGLSRRQLMALGNWRDERMLRRYAHLSDESTVEAASALVELIGNAKLLRRMDSDGREPRPAESDKA